jgi:hypothetical protein
VPTEQIIYILVAAAWTLTVAAGVKMVASGIAFDRRVRRDLARAGDLREQGGAFRYQPRVAIILPCRGVDEKLEHTVERLSRQNYDDYQVIFTLESSDDPAYAAIGQWTAPWPMGKAQRVVAGLAEQRSQKVHNLLAAVAAVGEDRDVLVFLDSDAVPGTDWLGYMVAPLQDRRVGAATGYRWYAATGGLASGLRCAWNAATLSLMEDPERTFCWGGATAMLRRTFVDAQVARYWDRAVSDDLQVTRAIRAAGLTIHFVPQALVPSHEPTTLKQFLSFARRQLLITRIGAPRIFASAMLLCLNFVIGGSGVAILFFAGVFGWIHDDRVMIASLLGWIAVLGLVTAKALVRQRMVRAILNPADIGPMDFAWDVGGAATSGLLHLGLMLSTYSSRQFVWRNTVYEMISPDETRIVRRY